MSQVQSPLASAPPPRQRLESNPSYEQRRAFIDRSFRWVGFSATFFGLAMLLVFLGDLTRDIVHWFQTMPAMVAERNEVYRSRVQEGEQLVARELKLVDSQMQEYLERADTPEKKAAVRKLFEEDIIPKKKAALAATMKDYEKDLESIREDTSPWSLFQYFMSHGPSNQPAEAGILPALLGSIWIGVLTVLIAVPLGVGAALYLEEYAPHTWLAKIIQVNISNLAGVPSVVFGILGAFVFVGMVFRPIEGAEVPLPWPFGGAIAARNLLGGAMTLALLTLPVIIVASQEAIRAIPLGLRHGAYALGATQWQVTSTIVLPSSLPGILTGTILAMCRAIGEAAPLVLFGALLFVNQNPTLFSRFTVMPMQIFGWADRPDLAWRNNAAVASMVLLVTLMSLNAVAIWMRQRAGAKARW